MSNTINYKEFKQAFIGAKISEIELRQLFEQLDINHDGEINYDEFLTGVLDSRLANSRAGRMLQYDMVKSNINTPSRLDNYAPYGQSSPRSDSIQKLL